LHRAAASGAPACQPARAVVARRAALAALGLAIGLVGAGWGTRLIRATLLGVTPTDPLSYVLTGAAPLIAAGVCFANYYCNV